MTAGLESVLTQIGVNVASETVWATIQQILDENNPTQEEFVDELDSHISELDVEGARAVADSAIKMLAEEGDIEVRDSHLYASDSFLMLSEPGTEFRVSDSTTETEQTKIEGEGAEIRGQGGAEIEQDEDGNITFRT